MKILTRLNLSLKQFEWSANFHQMWLPILFALAMGVFLCLQASIPYNENDHTYSTLALFFAAAFVFVATVKLSDFPKSTYIIIIGLLALAADCWWKISCHGEMGIESDIAHGVVYTLVFLSLFVVPNLRHKDECMVRFVEDSIVTLLLLCLSMFIVGLAITALLECIDILFSVHTQLTEYVWTSLLSITCCLFLLIMPRVGKRLFLSDFSVKAWSIFGKFIALPILLLYLLVLYAYIAKILIAWQLPDGTVTYMTVGVMAGVFTVEFFLHSRLYDESGSRFWRIMRHILPLLALPPLVLMSFGIARRVNDYGWTIDRFYVMVANAWFYGVCILLFISSFRKFGILRTLVLTLYAVVLLVTVIPNANIASLTRQMVTRDVEQLISKASVPFPDKAVPVNKLKEWFSQLDLEEANDIADKMSYLKRTFGTESLSAWVVYEKGEEVYDEFDVETNWHFSMNRYNGKIEFPEGYSSFITFYYPRECKLEETTSDGYMIISVPVKDDSTDKGMVRINPDKQYDYLTIYSEKGVCVIITRLYIRKERDNSNVECEGYFLWK